MRRSPAALAATALATCAFLTACSDSDASADDTVDVLASFYPLQYVVEQVGGEHVTVSNLTPPAAEPHDLELSPAQVRDVGTADLVVYLSGLQAATDEAVSAQSPEHVVDSAEAAEADAADPHFWLEPTRLSMVGDAVAAELSAIDPDNAADYAAGAEALAATLDELDEEFSEGLAQCEGATLVTSHEAFGYLADRYGLVQEGISGINPDAEPSPKRLRDVRAIVERDGVSTLFFERSLGPKVTQTLADDIGVSTALLDPLESRTDESRDYVDIMRANPEALTTGLACG
jgi:zinc transport system substrate-binding protein